ncbi:SCP-2 sterol transfer family protein [Evansella caseinilytica]|uniref:SCP-2 sterol transfer family protein n=1 Tax=Evansella caseinilytica TaxID=1503961 RepID=A0A1H3UP23_9BACI|nr:SCP-2 sterol transfer family protein [Evansella caseinilytica]
MYQILSSSVGRMKQSAHMQELLEKTKMVVCMICEDEQWVIHFDGKDINIDEVTETPADVVLEGNGEALQLLLTGEDFLLSMKKRGEIGVSGRLKDLLLLESLLYLSKKSR